MKPYGRRDRRQRIPAMQDAFTRLGVTLTVKRHRRRQWVATIIRDHRITWTAYAPTFEALCHEISRAPATITGYEPRGS